jgi:tetratricopeptide (TPR) repeat protein
MALCCFANHQYQLFYSCFERGLIGAQDDPLIISDVWYNVGYVYTLMGEKEMALEAYKLAVGQRPDHSEALNNMAVIEASRGKIDAAINYAEKAHREWPGFESAYNLSLWYFKTNQLEKANALNL